MSASIAADPVIGYMHRGYEKLTEVRSYPQITTLINRIDWLSSFANEVPFIHGAELLMGIEAPPARSTSAPSSPSCRASPRSCSSSARWACRSARSRRAFYGFRDREHVLNLIEAATGGRFHPNFNRIGGLKDDLPWGWVAESRNTMKIVLDACTRLRRARRRERDLRGVAPGRSASSPPRSAPSYGVSGSNLRASGVDWDLRRDGKPYLVYPELDFKVWTHPDGDCFSRYWVRLQETREAARMVVQMLDQIPAGPIMAKVPRIIKVPEGEIVGRDREPARPDGRTT